MISEGKQVLYYLYDGPKRSFVREELQVVPEDAELPPKSVLKGKHILFSLISVTVTLLVYHEHCTSD